MPHHRHRRALAQLLALALLPTLAAAQAEHRSHGAHAHGLARLDLAVEGGVVLIGLESPAANIVGFEHAPANAGERAALDAALATLKDGGRLFRLPADAGCRLVEAVVETPLTSRGRGGVRMPRTTPTSTPSTASSAPSRTAWSRWNWGCSRHSRRPGACKSSSLGPGGRVRPS